MGQMIKLTISIIFLFLLLSSCGDGIPDKPYNFYGNLYIKEPDIISFEQQLGSERIILTDSIMWEMDEDNSITPGESRTDMGMNLHCRWTHGNCTNPTMYLRKDKSVPFLHHVVEYWFLPNDYCSEGDSSSSELYRVFHKYFYYDRVLSPLCKTDTLTEFNYDEFLAFRKFLYNHYKTSTRDFKQEKDTHLKQKLKTGSARYTKYEQGYRKYKKWLGAQHYQGEKKFYTCERAYITYGYSVEIATDLSHPRSYYSNKQNDTIKPWELAIYVNEEFQKY